MGTEGQGTIEIEWREESRRKSDEAGRRKKRYEEGKGDVHGRKPDSRV